MSQVRGWHALLASNVVLLAALAWSATRSTAKDPERDVVRARLIELVDENGDMRAQLSIAENGGGELRLRNARGEIRVKLGATDDGALLLLMDELARPAVRLASEWRGASLSVGAPGQETVVGPAAVTPLSKQR